MIARIADAVSALFCAIFGLTRASEWSARIARSVGEISFLAGDEHHSRFVASSPLALWRAKTILTKEPETIQWISSFSPDDVLYDVGANVGIYSIFAAHECRSVYAFEPESQNFALLNRNIALNHMQDRIKAFPLAISDVRKLDTLRLSAFSPGAALHCFGTNVDFKGEEFVPAFQQGCMSTTLDELVFEQGLEFPTWIKIDVDGLEPEIIAGSDRVLHDARLRGVLVEVNETDAKCSAMIERLAECGLHVSSRGEAVTVSGGRITMRNYVFARGSS